MIEAHAEDRFTRPQRSSLLGFAAVFGGGVVAAQFGQLAWLVAGSRALPLADFGAVLAAQALYGLLLYAFDYGSALHGARLAAAGALDDEARAGIVRVRLASAAGAAIVALGIGAAGGGTLATAVAPFALALPLAALLRYWEPFGLGNGRPWAAYHVVRAWGPALAACAALAAGARLPVFVPGVVECAGLLGLMAAFRLRPARDLRQALQARGREWGPTLWVGLPSVAWQVGLLAGPVVLAAARAPAAAAVLAVAIRLLTGVNQLCGIVATSLFPALASAERPRRFESGLWTSLAVAGSLLAALLLAPTLVVELLFDRPSPSAEVTAIMVVGAGGAVGILVVTTMGAVALHGERALLRPLALASALALALYIGAAALQDPRVAGGALVLAQLTAVALVTRVVGGELVRPATVAFALAAAAAFAAAVERARTATALAILAALVVAALHRLARGASVPSAQATSDSVAGGR